MTAAPPSDAHGDLCAGCGLCCTGWLFHQTRLSADDARILSRLVVSNDTPDGPMLKQPCALHTGSSCSQYDARPAGCRSFRRASLAAHQRGELLFDEARARLDQTVDALRALEAALRDGGWMRGDDAGFTAWRRFGKALEAAETPVEFRRAHSEILLAGAVARTIGLSSLGDYF